MKNVQCLRASACMFTVMLLTGCRLPGKPGPDSVPQRPDAVSNFDTLYAQNCQACHGVHGRGGNAVSLASPAYIAYAGREHIAQITANGIGGSLMPAFARNQGGLLTDRQIQLLAEGIVSRWSNTASLAGATPPPYQSHAVGHPDAGQILYRADCLRCHAPGAQSILSPNYLALISDGGLRTLLVAGKVEQGMPDWRGYLDGPLSDQQLADLVSFLVSHRAPAASQPFQNAQDSATLEGDATAAARGQQRLATEAGPATGGPKVSTQSLPTATPKRPESVKP